MIKKKLSIIFLILLVLPLVLSNNYGAEAYGCGLFGIGCSTSTPTPTPDSPGGGGGSCNYDWQCTSWFPLICPESGIQERICTNKGTCTGTAGMPNQTQTCEYLGPSEPLFDIYLTLSDKYKEICAGNKIKANIKLENYAKVELLDAFMTYWIIDEDNKLITESKDTRAVEKETNFNIELKIPELIPKGTYRIYAQITYNGNKTAVTGESFEILSQEDCKLFSQIKFNWAYLIYGGIGILAVLLVLILIKVFGKREGKEIDVIIKKGEKDLKKGKLENSKNRYKLLKKLYESEYNRDVSIYKKIKNYYNNIMKKIKDNPRSSRNFLLGLFTIFIISLGIGLLFNTKRDIIGFVVGNSNTKNIGWNISKYILIIGTLGLLTFLSRNKIKSFIEKIKIKYPKDSLKGLMKKKVYLENGDYIGKVDEIILGENKINNLKIKLDKKQKFKFKGIIIKYENVKNIGHIVIIDNRIFKIIYKNLSPGGFSQTQKKST